MAFLAFVVLAGAVALSIWLINRDGVSEPLATTPVLSEMVTGDALLLELLAEQGVARLPIPESGDAYFLEIIARRSAQTLIELPSGEMLDVVTPLDGFPSLGPSPETGDAQVLEWLTR